MAVSPSTARVGKRDGNPLARKARSRMPARRDPTDAIRRAAIENAARERSGLDPLPPVTRLHPVSLDKSAPDPDTPDLPRGGRGRGSFSMTLIGWMAGVLVATFVWVSMPAGADGGAEPQQEPTTHSSQVRPTDAPDTERSHDQAVTERSQGDGYDERGLKHDPGSSESLGSRPRDRVPMDPEDAKTPVADPPEGPTIEVNGCELTLIEGSWVPGEDCLLTLPGPSQVSDTLKELGLSGLPTSVVPAPDTEPPPEATTEPLLQEPLDSGVTPGETASPTAQPEPLP